MTDDEKKMGWLIAALLVGIALTMMFFVQGCQQAQNGQGMVLSPVGQVAVSVGSLYVPEPYRTIGLLLLGPAGIAIGRKTKK